MWRPRGLTVSHWGAVRELRVLDLQALPFRLLVPSPTEEGYAADQGQSYCAARSDSYAHHVSLRESSTGVMSGCW